MVRFQHIFPRAPRPAGRRARFLSCGARASDDELRLSALSVGMERPYRQGDAPWQPACRVCRASARHIRDTIRDTHR